MKMMTSAEANKLLKHLKEEKEFWINKEREQQTYIAAVDEEPVVPDYNYEEVAEKIAETDDKITRIKHAINLANAENTVAVNGKEITIDMLLVRMAQLTARKTVLNAMRKRQPKARVNDSLYSRNKSIEYQYINYDLDTVKKDYEKIDSEIIEMQLALDRYNQVHEFSVDI